VKLAALFALLAGAACAQSPRIFYSKDFPGSQPAFVSIVVTPDGAAVYNDDPKEEAPLRFQLAKADVDEVFALAARLDHFRRPLEAPVKVAFLGTKTFRWENGSQKSEVKFNFTQDETARLLLDWFERMAESEFRLIDLERCARFDKLGVHKSLLELEQAWEQKRLVALDQFLPMLRRVARNDSYLHMARERAARLADTFERQKAQAAPAPPPPAK
jgi:hypothetical protein